MLYSLQQVEHFWRKYVTLRILRVSSLTSLPADLGSGVRHLGVSFLFPGFCVVPKELSWDHTQGLFPRLLLFLWINFIILSCVGVSVWVCPCGCGCVPVGMWVFGCECECVRVCVCVSAWVCPCGCRGVGVGVCTWVQVPTEAKGAASSRAGFTASHELPNMGAGIQTQVLYKSSTHSYLLNHLSSPTGFIFSNEHFHTQ